MSAECASSTMNWEKCSVILLDVAGTTTSNSFVRDTLFTFVSKQAEEFLKSQWEREAIKEALQILKEDTIDLQTAVALIKELTEKNSDNKGLKTIQGLIYKKGYESGDLKAHVFADVPPSFEAWTKSRKIGIYSTGSIESQQLLFSHTSEGDISAHISKYFDQSVGSKTDPTSYKKIANDFEVNIDEILFITDNIGEAKAAKSAGLKVAVITREGNEILSENTAKEFTIISSFKDVTFDNPGKRKIDETIPEEQPPSKVLKTEETGNEEISNQIKCDDKLSPCEVKIEDEAMEIDAPLLDKAEENLEEKTAAKVVSTIAEVHQNDAHTKDKPEEKEAIKIEPPKDTVEETKKADPKKEEVREKLDITEQEKPAETEIIIKKTEVDITPTKTENEEDEKKAENVIETIVEPKKDELVEEKKETDEKPRKEEILEQDTEEKSKTGEEIVKGDPEAKEPAQMTEVKIEETHTDVPESSKTEAKENKAEKLKVEKKEESEPEVITVKLTETKVESEALVVNKSVESSEVKPVENQPLDVAQVEKTKSENVEMMETVQNVKKTEECDEAKIVIQVEKTKTGNIEKIETVQNNKVNEECEKISETSTAKECDLKQVEHNDKAKMGVDVIDEEEPTTTVKETTHKCEKIPDTPSTNEDDNKQIEDKGINEMDVDVVKETTESLCTVVNAETTTESEKKKINESEMDIDVVKDKEEITTPPENISSKVSPVEENEPEKGQKLPETVESKVEIKSVEKTVEDKSAEMEVVEPEECNEAAKSSKNKEEELVRNKIEVNPIEKKEEIKSATKEEETKTEENIAEVKYEKNKDEVRPEENEKGNKENLSSAEKSVDAKPDESKIEEKTSSRAETTICDAEIPGSSTKEKENKMELANGIEPKQDVSNGDSEDKQNGDLSPESTTKVEEIKIKKIEDSSESAPPVSVEV